MTVGKWIDTRPQRPANPYVVMGVQFVGGIADVSRPISARAAETFAALGIIPEETGKDAPEPVEPETDEAPEPEAPARSKPKPKA